MLKCNKCKVISKTHLIVFFRVVELMVGLEMSRVQLVWVQLDKNWFNSIQFEFETNIFQLEFGSFKVHEQVNSKSLIIVFNPKIRDNDNVAIMGNDKTVKKKGRLFINGARSPSPKPILVLIFSSLTHHLFYYSIFFWSHFLIYLSLFQISTPTHNHSIFKTKTQFSLSPTHQIKITTFYSNLHLSLSTSSHSSIILH